MLRVASHTSGREVIDTGGDLLIGTSLQESFLKFKEHHRSCAIRRQVGAAFEVRLESQRTDLLTRKYMETVGQEQGTTACVGLNHVPSSHHFSSTDHTGTNRQDTKDNTNTSSSSRTNTSSTLISSRSSNTNNSSSHKAHPSSPLAEPERKPDISAFMSNHGKAISATNDSVTIKNEPLDNGSYSQGPKQPHPLSNCVTSNGENDGVFRNTTVSSGSKAKGRTRRTSRDIVKSLTLNHTPLYNDDNSDLTLTADDILNGKIGSSPLLKPLEEGEEIVQDVNSASNSTRAVTMATPTPTISTPAASAGGGRCDQSLIKQLDAFSKVMNQVEQQEKAKERRASFSSNHTPYSMVNPHLVSPPPYTMTSVPTPTPAHTVTSTLNHYGNPYNTGGMGYNDAPPYNTYTNNTETLHRQHRPQLRLPLSNTPSQLGQPLLSSPVCSQSPVHQRPLDYHHGNQAYTAPYSQASSSHWNTSQGVGSTPPTGMGSVTPTGMGPVTPTGMGPPITPTGIGPTTPTGLRTPLIGQKRHAVLPQYATPIKVPHLSGHPSNGIHPNNGPHPQVFIPSTSNTQPHHHQSFLPAYHS